MFIHPEVHTQLIHERQREMEANGLGYRDQRDCPAPVIPGRATRILRGLATAIARAVARPRQAGATAEILTTAQRIASALHRG